MAIAGVVCEGHSDFAILREVIHEVWPEMEEVLLLQPILDRLGHAQGASGASGVVAWCTRNAGALDGVIDPGVGPRLDLLVIALDADAAIDAGIEDPPTTPSAYDASRLYHLVTKKLLAFDARLKRQHKVVKPPDRYRAFAAQVAAKWSRVTKRCGEAERFGRKVLQLRQRSGA
jgi:hypothetical protein